MKNPVREDLPEPPERIARLPVDRRGYPVPAFVATVDGEPDHRVVERQYMPRAVKHNLCWTCGEPMGVYKTFVIGPMCCVNRVSAEPPSHLDCATYSVRACPFMTKPQMRRREAGLPEVVDPGGIMFERNPGVMCLWTTRTYKPFRVTAGDGFPSLLFDVGEPTGMQWFRAARPATRAEVMEGIASGLPNLVEVAERGGGQKAVRDVDEQLAALVKLLDKFGSQEGA